MDAPEDPPAVRRPAPPVTPPGAESAARFETEPVIDQVPEPETVVEAELDVESQAFEPDIELLDRAEATYAGAAKAIELVDAGDLDQAESLLDSLVGQSSE